MNLIISFKQVAPANLIINSYLRCDLSLRKNWVILGVNLILEKEIFMILGWCDRLDADKPLPSFKINNCVLCVHTHNTYWKFSKCFENFLNGHYLYQSPSTQPTLTKFLKCLQGALKKMCKWLYLHCLPKVFLHKHQYLFQTLLIFLYIKATFNLQIYILKYFWTKVSMYFKIMLIFMIKWYF